MTDTAKLEDLVGRVEAATGPDRELDGAIALAVGGWHRDWLDEGRNPHHMPDWYWWHTDDHPHQATDAHPRYTSSIDAALALAERVLPGYRWGVSQAGIRTGKHPDGKHPDGKTAYSDGFKAHVTEASPLRPMPTIAEARTAPLAIILATLRSLRIKGDHNDEA